MLIKQCISILIAALLGGLSGKETNLKEIKNLRVKRIQDSGNPG
jgi:hypothetical protein